MSYEERRAELLQSLRRGIRDSRVLAVMSRIPRELFVPASMRGMAYEDRPLPIGEGQTISQPYIVAFMTQELQLTAEDKVLELGTGSGYQTAILADLAKQVVTTERVPSLSDSARDRLESLDYTNIEFRIAGDTLGWPEEAPYNAILVTAGAPHVPDNLVAQLAERGRLIIPVGSRYDQELYRVVRVGDDIRLTDLGGCRFVPLIGKGAWEE